MTDITLFFIIPVCSGLFRFSATFGGETKTLKIHFFFRGCQRRKKREQVFLAVT